MKPGHIIATKKINNWEIVFRTPKLTDAEKMQQFINVLSKEKTYISMQGEQMTLEEEQKFLKSLLKSIKEKKALYIQAWNDQELIGVVDVRNQEKIQKHVAGLGLLVKKEYRNYGIGTELLKIAIKQASASLKDTRIITLQAFSENSRAIHLYQKLGFEEYGILPNGYIQNNQYHDTVLMSLDLKSS